MKIRFLFLATLFSTTSLFAQYDTKQQKIIICGVGKNIARCLPNMMRSIDTLGSFFKDYRVIIYENNSTDNTRAILTGWAKQNPKVTVFSETVSAEQLLTRVQSRARRDQAPCRMELIAYARNQVLAAAMQDTYNDYSFVLMTDLDFMRGWNPKDVLQSFSIQEDWDCIAAHSIAGGYVHYDRYAFRDPQFPLGPELIGEDFWADVGRKPLTIHPNSGLKRVYSAFGGLAIYKRQSLKGIRYSGFITEDLTILMDKIINEEIPTDHPQYLTYKSTIGYNTKSGKLPIQFQPNSGYDGPVCCEHSTLHASMMLNGHDKIYVNPNMICKY